MITEQPMSIFKGCPFEWRQPICEVKCPHSKAHSKNFGKLQPIYSNLMNKMGQGKMKISIAKL